MFLDFISILANVLFILNILFVFIVVFYERRNPAVTWAWMMVMLLIPFFGFIIYLILGLDSRKVRAFYRKVDNDNEIYQHFLEGHITTQATADNPLVNLNTITGQSALSQHNKLALFHDGNAKFESLLDDIKKAKHFIHLEYYIVRQDSLILRILDVLTQKANEGVEIRFLMDGMGCRKTSKKIFMPLQKAGGQIAFFLPTRFMRINFRNHRKLAIIDGQIAYLGGLNIGEEYLGAVKRYGYWRDSHIRIKGEAVHPIQLRFVMDWNFCCQINERIPKRDEKYFPSLTQCYSAHNIGVQIVSSGPDTAWPSVQYAYAKMITEAKESIYIQSPYFVPDDNILESIRIAALSGVNVKIIIPGNPDHPFVYWAALSYLNELLRAGVKCYQYTKGFIHSKLIIVDGFVTSVGTANMDVRSFKLNFETNAFIYDSQTASDFEAIFIQDLKDSTEITLEWYRNLSKTAKIKESISRLLSPLL